MMPRLVYPQMPMVKYDPTILSQARGSLGGVTFEGCRTRNGIVTTMRERVRPTQPNTVRQQLVRGRLKEFCGYIRGFDYGYYANWFNNAVGSLAGCQSLQSLLLSNVDPTDSNYPFISGPAPIARDGLHWPDAGINWVVSGDQLSFTWSTELGANGADSDRCWVMFFGLQRNDAQTLPRPNGVSVIAARNAGGGSVYTGGGDWSDYGGFWVLLWFTTVAENTTPFQSQIANFTHTE